MLNTDVKWVNLLTDQTKDNAAFTAVVLDCKGFDYAELALVFQNVPANVAGIKIEESDNNSDYSDVTPSIVGTALQITGAASALPGATGGDDTITLFEIDLRKRKRYMKLTATAGDGSGTHTELTAVARLSRAGISPVTAAEKGAAQVLRF
jgi:hypothetical protein